MSQDTGGLIIAKGTTAQQPTCTAANLGSIRENTDKNKVEVCTAGGGTPAWQFLEEAGPSFVPLTVDYLVVAGGGGGGAYSRIVTSLGGTGGGAGGYRTSFGTGNVNGGNTAIESTLTTMTAATPYQLTVGAGGAGGPVNPTPTNAATNPTRYADQGDNSVFHTITSTGGGGGYEPFTGTPNSAILRGGSNAGSGGNGTAAVSYTTSPVQGFIGGRNTTYSSPFGSGGGGGASSVGGNGGSSSLGGGNGGAGFSNQISGTAVDYAGGGGGSVNKDQGVAGTATFGGGDGNRNGAGYDGTLNTGGGGGGASGPDSPYTSYKGGDGGSGVVILRYPSAYTINFQTGVGFISSTATLSATSEKVTTITAGSGTITFA
jgi:hypothetical protein